jgi:hypothetical protein
MALSAFLESFAVSTGVAGTTQARTGYGFQPKALLVWGTINQSATDTVTSGASDSTFGFATSTSARRCIGTAHANGGAAGDTARSVRNDAVAVVNSTGASITALLDVQSFDSDGWTAAVDDQYTAARIMHVLALGGADITNVAILDFAASTSLATQAVTGVGFLPDCLVILGISTTTSGTTAASHAIASIGIVGAATAAGNALLSSCAIDAQNPTVAKSYSRNGESLVGFSTAGAINGRGYVSSFDADGFTITWNAQPSSAYQFYVLAIKGGSFSVGDVTTRTDTTTDITETGIGFQPVAGLLLSHNKAASAAGTVDADYRQSIGAFTGASSEFASGIFSQDAVTPSVTARGAEFDSSYMNISTSDTLDGAMDITSVDSGGYTARMGDADPAGAFVAHLLFGSTVVGGSAIAAISGNLQRMLQNQ